MITPNFMISFYTFYYIILFVIYTKFRGVYTFLQKIVCILKYCFELNIINKDSNKI